MNSAIRIVLVLAVSLAVSAGQAGAGEQAGAPGGPAAPPAPQQRATAPRPAQVRAYAPPIDGKITPDQVKRYIAVRRRALELVKQGAPGASSFQLLAEVVAAETRAAGELSFDVNEYRWVQSRVAEASPPATPAGGSDISKVIEAAAAKGVAQLQATTETKPPVSGRTPTTQTALAHNRGVIEPFRADLAALEKQTPRVGT